MELLKALRKRREPKPSRNDCGWIFFPIPKGFFTTPDGGWLGSELLMWEKELVYINADPTPEEIAEYERRREEMWYYAKLHLPEWVDTGSGYHFEYKVRFRVQFDGTSLTAAEQQKIPARAKAIATELVDGLRRGTDKWAVCEARFKGVIRVVLIETNML